jgi:RNA polymerase sigma-70 factor (ECF subfamily)
MSAGADPESVVISSENVRQVHAALGGLAQNQRMLLELAYYEGLSHAEIAARTGVPLGTVTTRLRSAMETLREALSS